MRRRLPQDRETRREEALRPSRYLGYRHDRLGRHMLERGALEIAEACFRRAIWLNPYSPTFKFNLACCLYRRHRIEEVEDILDDLRGEEACRNEVRTLEELLRRREPREGGSS